MTDHAADDARSWPPTSSEHPATDRFGYPIYHAETLAQWAAWLRANHEQPGGVWLATWKATSGRPVLAYEAAVEEALCWGWIDSTARSLDDDRRLQLMTPRRPRSHWSASNKDRVERLLADGRMQPSGLAAVEVAKANGSWTIFDDVEALVEPDDLAAVLDADPEARAHWDGFPPSAKKQMLWQVKSAVKATTRASRIARIVGEARAGRRATG